MREIGKRLNIFDMFFDTNVTSQIILQKVFLTPDGTWVQNDPNTKHVTFYLNAYIL